MSKNSKRTTTTENRLAATTTEAPRPSPSGFNRSQTEERAFQLFAKVWSFGGQMRDDHIANRAFDAAEAFERVAQERQ